MSVQLPPAGQRLLASVEALWKPQRTPPPAFRRPVILGVDFGGTRIKLGIVDARGRCILGQTVGEASARELSRPRIFVEWLGRTAALWMRCLRLSPSRLLGVCVGAPGLVDADRGLVHVLVNVPGWRNVPLRRLLQQRLRCRCLVDNDANLAALGEWRFGAGRGAKRMVCLTLGTGVGGGLIIDGRLYRGRHGAAGEIGHMVIDPQGPRCGCGNRGCLEAHVGTAAILRMGKVATPEQLSVAAKSGNRKALRVWKEFGRLLGIGVANLVNILDPDCVVIGGGVSNAWPYFAPSLQRTVRALAMDAALPGVRIVRATLGHQAGIVGSAVLMWDDSIRQARRRPARVTTGAR